MPCRAPRLVALGLLLTAAVACSGEPSGGTVDVATTDAGSADGAGETAVSVTVADFDCITTWTQVNRMWIKSLNGQLDAALKVAKSPTGGTYPAGTVIQLIPNEAMVKREAGFSPATQDWEFFYLKVSEGQTSIAARGTTDVKNGFGGNCFGCHSKAKPEWDLVCEQDHGCDPLPFSGEAIRALQQADSRCK